MSAIIISPRGPRISVGSLWRLRHKVRREVGGAYQVGIHLRAEVESADPEPPFVDIVVEEILRGMAVDAVVGALKVATERWRAGEAAPSLKVARVRVWVYDHERQLHLEWEEGEGAAGG
jgi:ribosomal protein L31E